MTLSRIQLHDFTARFDGKPVVRGVNLEIVPHECLAIIGPAGSGKTTLLRSLNRLNDLDQGFSHSGRILHDGKDIYASTVDLCELRRKIGMVFAVPVPLPWSIYENLVCGLRLAGERDGSILNEQVRKALGYASLWDEVKDRLHEPAATLSGGQQQRLCIARALTLEPEVLILDEPCSGLDPLSTARIEDALIELRKNHSIVLVTNSTKQAARASDRTAFLLFGELIEVGETPQMFTFPLVQQTKDYLEGRFG